MSMITCTKRQSNEDFWAKGLPDDVVHMILEKLALRYWSRFAKVCKSWKSLTQEAYCRTPNRWCCPWLVAQEVDMYSFPRIAFYSVTEDERKLCSNKLTSLAHIPGGYLHGSHQDWMIVSHYEEGGHGYFFSLINPFTDVKITLPRLGDSIYIFSYILLVSTTPTDPDCIYMCLPLHRSDQHYLCTTQQSKEWFHNSLGLNIFSATSSHSKQSFYGLTRDNDIWCLKFSDVLTAIRQQEKGLEKEDKHVRFSNLGVKMPKATRSNPTSSKNFTCGELVESSCGDILLVVKSFVYNNTNQISITTNFKIYRLDMSTTIHDLKWVELDGFREDHILFINPKGKSKILLKARDLGIAEGNSIYFFDGNNTPRTYSFKDKKFGSFSHSPLRQRMLNPQWLSAPLRWYLYN